jgi:hypothetical protein
MSYLPLNFLFTTVLIDIANLITATLPFTTALLNTDVYHCSRLC